MQIDAELSERLAAFGCTIEPCGSRVTCRPVRDGADYDYLVQVPRDERRVSDVVEALHEAGFKFEGAEHYQQMAANDFMSWRQGDVNLIVTANAGFAERHRAATHVATRLNLRDKADRVALVQAVLYGNKWEDATNV